MPMSDTLVARASSAPASEGSWEGELSALESRAEIDCLDDLQQRRRALIASRGRLLALFGPFGLFDDRRKQFLEAQKILARRALTEQGAKVTEAMVEAEAYGSKAYQTLLDNALDDRVEFLNVQTELSDIEEKIKNRESALWVYGQELKLAR